MGGPAQRYYCVGRPAGRIQKWRRRRVVGRFARSRNILVSGQGHATHMWERRILLSWQGQDVRRSFIAFWGATSRMLNGTAWAGGDGELCRELAPQWGRWCRMCDLTCAERRHCARYIEIAKLQIPRSWLDPQPVTDPCCDPASGGITMHIYVRGSTYRVVASYPEDAETARTVPMYARAAKKPSRVDIVMMSRPSWQRARHPSGTRNIFVPYPNNLPGSYPPHELPPASE